MEARPDLTWRDIQYLCIKTARQVNPEDPDWEITSTGQPYSYKYGFGALDAWRFITAAKEWTVVKPQTWFKTHSIRLGDSVFDGHHNYTGGVPIPQQATGERGVKSTMTVTQEMLNAHNFESLEHINVRVWIKHGRRGDVEVEIVSPKGVKSILGAHRIKDTDTNGYPGWTFMSVKHWYVNSHLQSGCKLTHTPGVKTQLVTGPSVFLTKTMPNSMGHSSDGT